MVDVPDPLRLRAYALKRGGHIPHWLWLAGTASARAEGRVERDRTGPPSPLRAPCGEGSDVEPALWQSHDVSKFPVDAERIPTSQAELFSLALARLDDLKLDLEEGDESEATLLQKVQDEFELRRVIANRLKHTARGKYTTGSEEELADETRTDIRLQ